MADTLVSSISPFLNATFTRDLDFRDPADVIDINTVYALANGTGANQADLVWADRRSLTAGNSENIDLAGSLTDSFGTSITFARVKAFRVYNNDTVTTMDIGGAASNAWATWVGAAPDFVLLRPTSGMMLWATGATAWAVTAGTGDILKIARAAGSPTDATYDIVIIGASA